MQHPPPPHMSSARVAGHMGAPESQGPLEGHTGRYTLIQGHTHTHSHMATRSHMGAHRHTHTHRLMFLQVTLVLPPRVAGILAARMLTVVLELGLLTQRAFPSSSQHSGPPLPTARLPTSFLLTLAAGRMLPPPVPVPSP